MSRLHTLAHDTAAGRYILNVVAHSDAYVIVDTHNGLSEGQCIWQTKNKNKKTALP